MASRQGLKHVSEELALLADDVASGMASRQGLKQQVALNAKVTASRRQWNGFPSGIETPMAPHRTSPLVLSPVEWLPVRD